MILTGLGGGRKPRCEEGRRISCAHLREGACCELKFLLKQGAQHLVLPFQVKYPLLQLDALLPQVLPPPGGGGRQREDGGERKSGMSTVAFIRAAGTPAGHALLLQPPSLRELTLPMFTAITSSGDGKFSNVYHPWSEVIPFPLATFTILEPIPCLLESTRQRRAHIRQRKTWGSVAHMSRNYPHYLSKYLDVTLCLQHRHCYQGHRNLEKLAGARITEGFKPKSKLP